MEKIILKDNTAIEIKEGGSLGSITAITADFTALGVLADALFVSGNLDSVRFKTGENVTGEYAHMKLETPLFKTVDIQDCNVLSTFSICKKTEMELAIEELQAGQDLQDGAIGDLGELVSGLAEGGAQ